MKPSAAAILSVGENGQVTIPASFRRAHSLSGGSTVVAVPMGDALVMVPHDGALEAICLRLEAALRGSGHTVAGLQRETLRQREAIVAERYPELLGAARSRRR